MPILNAKQMKGSAAKKAQIAEKVKEIQQRQKNWMQQRDSHLKSTPPKEAIREQPTSESRKPDPSQSRGRSTGEADILRVHHDTPQENLASQMSDKLNVKVKHGFGNWLQSRKEATEVEDHSQWNGGQENEHYYDGHGMNDNHSGALSAQTSSYPASGGVSTLVSSSRNYPLSPAEFDSLADRIASRVKENLGISGDLSAGGGVNGRGDSVDSKHRDYYARGKTFVSETEVMEKNRGGAGVTDVGLGGGGDDAVDVSSHRCPVCSTLMAGSEHVPTLLVPCGHTVCKACSTSHGSCRMCGTRVASLTTNIMLQQIILEFHRKKHSTARKPESELPPIPSSKTTAKRSEISYSTQLQSLLDRREALQEEVTSRQMESDRVTAKVKRAETQLRAIQREEEGLVEQLKELGDRLQGLRQHREEYDGEYRHLLEEQKAANSQTALVEQTLKSLGEEIDKVQFLAEGQNNIQSQSYNHRR